MKIIENQSFDMERALYESDGLTVINCRFDGIADGESAFKESKNLIVKDTYFNLRYPFWHDTGVEIENCELTPSCRAALWYTNNVNIKKTKMHGIKALRECCNVYIENSSIASLEYGWKCNGVKIERSFAEGEYFMLESKNLEFEDFSLKGKYSFQYIENATLEGCELDTKDAFWHAKNVIVKNSRIKGEYLGWYCENVTFENCIIEGTQPLCYCKNLRLINCEMHGCDLSFEKSDVYATITTKVDSIKNVLSGEITAPCVDEIIKDKEEYRGKITVLNDSKNITITTDDELVLI